MRNALIPDLEPEVNCDRVRATPESRLWMTVLEHAIVDFRQSALWLHSSRLRQTDTSLIHAQLRQFESNRRFLFGAPDVSRFVWICDSLSFDPELIRSRLRFLEGIASPRALEARELVRRRYGHAAVSELAEDPMTSLKAMA